MRTLLLIILVILALNFLFRLLAPYIFNWGVKRMEKKVREQFGGNDQQKSQTKKKQKEGEVSIEQTEKKDKLIEKNMGDYVDYEEEK